MGITDLKSAGIESAAAVAFRTDEPTPGYVGLRPVFVVGCMRSGTTLLGNLLGAHSGLQQIGWELRHEWSTLGAAPTGGGHCVHRNASHLRHEPVAAMRDFFLDQLGDAALAGVRPLNKSPHLGNKIRYVQAMFPDAKFIHIIRDPWSHSFSLRNHLQKVTAGQRNQRIYWPGDSTHEPCWQVIAEADVPAFPASQVYPGDGFATIPEAWTEITRYTLEALQELDSSRAIALSYNALVNHPREELARLHHFLELPVEVDNVDEAGFANPGRLVNATTRDPLHQWEREISDVERGTIKHVLQDRIEDLVAIDSWLNAGRDRVISDIAATVRPQPVHYVALGIPAQSELHQRMLAAVSDVLSSGQFILGSEVQRFEDRFAELAGTKHAIAVANGTDALVLSLKGLGVGEGDEVITVPNSFLASASAVILAGATPVFVDVDAATMNMDPSQLEAAITSRTKAILPVHLTGRPADMTRILEFAQQHNLFVIEDAAQAVGATHHGQPVGSFGIAGCFSLHPLKNLAAAGDGGVITTNDENLATWLRNARNHGLVDRDTCAFWSVNSRLDALQAALLNVKLDFLPQWTAKRRALACLYTERLRDVVQTPLESGEDAPVYHTYIIQTDRRDELQEYLKQHGVDTKVHYPIPIHLQPAAVGLGYGRGMFPVSEQLATRILSLPVHPGLEEEDVELIGTLIRRFHGGG